MHPLDWSSRSVWLFDLDGTLTIPVHDFAHARAVLGIPTGADILHTLAARPPAERLEAERWLRAWELDLADHTGLQPDAQALLTHLHRVGCRFGILTRNTREVALRTLDAIGLRSRFADHLVLGRTCAPPKPHPAGIRLLLDRLHATPDRAVMVGDYLHDVRAGRAAGTATVLVRRKSERGWEGEADLVVDHLWPLDAHLPGP